jgi:hypothetical protein
MMSQFHHTDAALIGSGTKRAMIEQVIQSTIMLL